MSQPYRYPDPDSRSAALFARARGVLANGYSRVVASAPGPGPYVLYARSAQGARVTDADGHELIDFNNNNTALIHGHAHPAIVEAVSRQIAGGSAYSFGSEAELALAELLRERCPAPAKVNLIPYNPVPELDQLRRPSSGRVHGFAQVLRAAAVPVTVRKEKGQEVAAACGQLRRHAGRHACG